MAPQVSRNDYHEMLATITTPGNVASYRTFNYVAMHPITGSDKRAVTKLAKSLYYRCHANLPPGSPPT